MSHRAPTPGHTRPDPAAIGLVLPVVTGLLLAASFPPLDLVVPPFVALVPLAIAIHRLGGADRLAARQGLVAGVVSWGVLLFWIPRGLETVTSFGLLLYLGAVFVLAGFTALFAWTLVRLHRVVRLPYWIAVPVAWTACEWLRAHVGPFSLPWLELGIALASSPTLAAPAELVGARGLSFWLALSSGLCASMWVATERGSRRRLMGGVVLCLVIPMVWGAARNRSLDMVRVGRVAVFQPNVTRELRAAAGGADSTLARLAVLVQEVSSEEFDLAVWPEATFTRDPRQDPDLSAAISELVDALGSPVLFGAYLSGPVEDGGSVEFNGALLWRPEQGGAELEYRKHRLVPGVEVVPLMDPGRLRGTTRVRGFGRGPGVQTQELADGLTFSPLICFESTFSSDTRRAARQGAGLLVSLTNDAWFGARADAHPTVGMRHHAAHSVIRAVETRTGLARAANTGISMFVDPLGRTTGRIRPFSMAVHVESVYGTGRQTLFVRFGDLLGTGSAAVVLLTIVLSGIVQSKRDRPTH